jgi:hypothetical protein
MIRFLKSIWCAFNGHRWYMAAWNVETGCAPEEIYLCDRCNKQREWEDEA